MWIVGLALLGIIIYMIAYEWWKKYKYQVRQLLSNVKTVLAKAAGYVVVEHILVWHSFTIVEREFFLAGTPEEIIADHNDAFAIRKKLKHELHYESDVTVYWKFV